MKYFLRKNWKYIIVLSVGILSFIGVYIYNYNNDNKSITTKSNNKVLVSKKEESNKEEKKGTVFVDVKGAVNAPGVYEIEEEKRIIDAINLAGGLSDNANTVNINLSKKVADEMYIIVYTKNEIYNYNKKNGSTNNITCASNECVCPDANNDACIKKSSSKSNNEVIVSGKVSINTATKEELMTLSGVGESKANAIISYRQDNGNFNTLEDIKNVSGIGDALYEKIKDNISL